MSLGKRWWWLYAIFVHNLEILVKKTKLSLQWLIRISLRRLNHMTSGDPLYLRFASCIPSFRKEESLDLLDSVFLMNSIMQILKLHCSILRSILLCVLQLESSIHSLLLGIWCVKSNMEEELQMILIGNSSLLMETYGLVQAYSSQTILSTAHLLSSITLFQMWLSTRNS